MDQRLRFAESMNDLAAQGVKLIHGRLKPEDLLDLIPSYISSSTLRERSVRWHHFL
ncbi:hypothetical protein [Paenibacillus lautus]|uniref:hypothetical protein n=1 Tax=Paenibacillus lautus TaxID=1401 RepID=UPI001BD08CD4|nr:hypothetical protein [Paenibacillus lautus]